MTGLAIHSASLSQDISGHIDFQREGEGSQIGRLSAIRLSTAHRPKQDFPFLDFEGQAIIPPPEAKNLLTIPEGFETLLTFALLRDFHSAPRLDVSGLSQGAVMELGKGRVAVFGETGSFTSQIREGAGTFRSLLSKSGRECRIRAFHHAMAAANYKPN